MNSSFYFTDTPSMTTSVKKIYIYFILSHLDNFYDIGKESDDVKWIFAFLRTFNNLKYIHLIYTLRYKNMFSMQNKSNKAVFLYLLYYYITKKYFFV